MRALFALLMIISIPLISILGMILGWGLEAENWGWIAFSYLWMIFAPSFVKLLE